PNGRSWSSNSSHSKMPVSLISFSTNLVRSTDRASAPPGSRSPASVADAPTHISRLVSGKKLSQRSTLLPIHACRFEIVVDPAPLSRDRIQRARKEIILHANQHSHHVIGRYKAES